MLFSIGKSFLHPVTLEKITVLGSDYESALREAGIKLDIGGYRVPEHPPSWSEYMASPRMRVGKELPEKALLEGFLPEDDAESYRQHGIPTTVTPLP